MIFERQSQKKIQEIFFFKKIFGKNKIWAKFFFWDRILKKSLEKNFEKKFNFM